MPTKYLSQQSQTGLAPDVTKRPDPVDEYTPAALDSLGKSVSSVINNVTLGNAQEALEAGELQRESAAMSGMDAYKNKLYEAAAAQDTETFGKFYSEAQRFRSATLQGIMQPSEAQLRLNKLEKDMAYAHPHLAAELRASASALSGNATQIAALVKDDPAAKAMEELFKSAWDKGMTPNEYMTVQRKKTLGELRRQELQIAADTRAYDSQQYVAELGLIWENQNTEVSLEFISQLEQEARAAGGMIPGADMKAKLMVFKETLRKSRENEINGLIRDRGAHIDRKEAVKMLDDQLAWIDRYADNFLAGKSYTFEHMKALKDWEIKVTEWQQKQDFRGLLRDFPPLQQYIFSERPEMMIPFMEKAMTLAAAQSVHPNLPSHPGWQAKNPGARFSMESLLEGDKSGLVQLLGGRAMAVLLNQPEASIPSGSYEVDSKSSDLALATWSGMPEETKVTGAASIAAHLRTTKIASTGDEALFMAIRSTQEGITNLNNNTTQELSVALKDIIPYIQIGGGDPLTAPFQLKAGATPSMKTNQSLMTANQILRNYAIINPAGYMEFLDITKEQIWGPPVKKENAE